jgi:hypothetical protein
MLGLSLIHTWDLAQLALLALKKDENLSGLRWFLNILKQPVKDCMNN